VRLPMFPTSLVGSYAQPSWLIDREALRKRFPPRTRAGLWRVDDPYLQEAQDDATLIAVRDQERAGLDVITDGEMRRESYSNRFANSLEGVDREKVGAALDRSGEPNQVPLVTGRLRRTEPVQVRDVEFLRANTDRPVKITIPGPFTMAQQAQNAFYGSEEAMALDYAAAVNAEIRDLFAAGADIVQLDEPYLQARVAKAREYGVKVVDRALDGIDGLTALHICFGYAHVIHDRPEGYSFLAELGASSVKQISIETAQSNLDLQAIEPLRGKDIILGVLDLSTSAVESTETVAARIERALPHADPGAIWPAPDFGLKYLSRGVAFAKMQALVEGAREARRRVLAPA
jgi:5-methyltetrahydropteroyltriglutamate--homocysteine methyltransferase